ncbi:MAG: GNAT family N-acetyltransferase [Bacteroidales bacterium]|nr:GNAT family N-acetyltransferase [Bacteroidales bacterium]
MIFREANSNDINGLFEVWKTCFTDDISYIDNYFKFCFPYTRTLVADTGSGEIASSITLIPATAPINNEAIKGYYLYAVGTKPEHRGIALSSSLIDLAKRICRNENLSFLITKPASESLYGLYKRYGFFKTLYEEHISEPLLFQKSASYSDNLQTSPLTLFNFEKFRNNSDNKFLWSREVLNYILLETSERNGFCILVEGKDNPSKVNYLISYPISEDIETIRILETDMKEYNHSILHRLISHIYPHATTIETIRPNSSRAHINNLKKSGLFLPLEQEASANLENFSIMLPME